ncbi:MAG: hypothetical protein HY887_00655 [Deltaproteobacteria bacterium]|nr:hypothetical protein [Deltaproteobacteria bacterium]
MNYIISVVAAIIGLFLGNWLSFLFYFPFLLILGKVSPNAKGLKSATLTLYVSRACMGVVVSLLYWLFSYFGALRSVLTITFGIWALLLSEPFSEVQAYDIFKEDWSKYQGVRWWLKITRLVSYFVTSFIVMGLTYL